MSFKLKPLAALIAGATLSALAQADDQVLSTVNVSANAEQTQSYKPDFSTVGGKTATATRDIPQVVNVVNKALMESQGATSLTDALRNVPGITIGGAEGGQIGNNINLRGFSARTDIYMNGFRDRGQYYRDLFDIEQIEVLQGPSSMLFGRGSTGGVINQVTKQAQLRPFTVVSATVGTDGRMRSTLDTNTKLSDTSAMRVNFFAQDLQTTRDTMSNKDFGIAPTVRFGIGTPTEITLSGLLQHNNDMPDYGVQSLNGRPITASRKTFYGQASDHTNQDIAMLNGTIRHVFSPSLELRSQASINRYTTNAVETAPQLLGVRTGSGLPTALSQPAFGTYSPSSLWVKMQSHDRNIIDTSLDSQTDLISRFKTGFLKHELITGFELGHDTYSNQSLSRTGAGMSSGTLDWVSLTDPSQTLGGGAVTSTVGNLAKSSANSVGSYFNDTISITDHWKAVAGLRYDTFHGQIRNTTSAPVGLTKQDSNYTSRRAGLIYQPTRTQSYYVSYGTSFNPLLEQMTLTSGTQNMPPTNTRSYEVGGKWDLAHDRISLSAAAFDQLQNNVYVKDPSSGLYTSAGNWRIKGYQLGAVGHVTDKLQVSAGYMHLRARVVNTPDATNGSVPSNVPNNTATLWTTYNLTPTWEVGGGAYFMSKRYVADTATNVDLVSVPSYVRYDATVAYHKPKYDLRVNLLNLTNKFYYDGLIQSDGGRSVPGIGRTALLTGTYKF